MNERIKELAEQADLYARSDNSSMLFENYQKRYTEKFAELIVRECADQCTTDGPFGAEVVWGKQFHDKIKKHFGVE